MITRIQEIGQKTVEDFRNADKKAKQLLQILICGSHEEMDIKIIEQFRDKQRERGIEGTFLLKDLQIILEDGKEPLVHEKVHHVWNVMKKGDNIPLIILFAGKSASQSQGLNAEIQTISHDREKISCAHLFKVEGVKLVSHEECFTHIRIIKNDEEFSREAEKVIDSYFHQAKMYYQAEQERKNEQTI